MMYYKSFVKNNTLSKKNRTATPKSIKIKIMQHANEINMLNSALITMKSNQFYSN